MKITDLLIDPRSFGERLWLVDVVAAYEYNEGKRTDKIVGYRYVLALPDRGLDKVSVKIAGPQQIEKPDGYVPVELDKLEIYIYGFQGSYQFGARASGIHPTSDKP